MRVIILGALDIEWYRRKMYGVPITFSLKSKIFIMQLLINYKTVNFGRINNSFLVFRKIEYRQNCNSLRCT